MDELTGKAGSAYQQARAMKEKYFAMQAKIAYEKEVGLLLEASEVRFAIADGDAIIRNRLKVAAIIHNARVIQHLRASHGGFATWLDAHHPRDKPAWVKLFGKTFKFTGGEIVGEFLMSLGYLKGAHAEDCPVHAALLALAPPWTRTSI